MSAEEHSTQNQSPEQIALTNELQRLLQEQEENYSVPPEDMTLILQGHIPTILIYIEQVIHNNREIWDRLRIAEENAFNTSTFAMLAPISQDKTFVAESQQAAEEARVSVLDLKALYDQQLGQPWEQSVILLYGGLVTNHPNIVKIWEMADGYKPNQAQFPTRMAHRLEKLYLVNQCITSNT